MIILVILRANSGLLHSGFCALFVACFSIALAAIVRESEHLDQYDTMKEKRAQQRDICKERKR